MFTLYIFHRKVVLVVVLKVLVLTTFVELLLVMGFDDPTNFGEVAASQQDGFRGTFSLLACMLFGERQLFQVLKVGAPEAKPGIDLFMVSSFALRCNGHMLMLFCELMWIELQKTWFRWRRW